MNAAVYITLGGERFHDDRACRAFVSGRDLFGWLCDDSGPVYPKQRITAEDAALLGYTACRVCVPPALALPATGQTYGHERLTINPSCCGDDCCGGRTEQQVCGRCSEDATRREGARWLLAVPWPCTSAVVLGLAPRGGV